MYHYLGYERLQLWFFSPNVCAIFLCMTVLFSIGLFSYVFYQKKIIWKITGTIMFPIIVLQFILLVLTYSRGGYLACFIALLTVCIFSPKKNNFAFLIVFSAIILITANGISRIESMKDIVDGSIQNRLFLWRGGAGIVATYWNFGTGDLAEIGALYTKWYQPLWLQERYSTLINDYLTIAAQSGIIILFFALTVLCFLLQQGFFLYLKEKNYILLYTCASILSYMVAVFFSTCYRFINVIWLFGVLILIVISFIVYSIIKKKIKWQHWNFWLPPLFSFFSCTGIIVFGIWVNQTLPYTWKYEELLSEEGKLKILSVIPRQEKKNGFRVLIPVSSLDKVVRSHLRPLALAGFTSTAITIDINSKNLDSLTSVVQTLSTKYFSESVLLFGHDEERSIQVLAVAAKSEISHLTAVITVDSPFEWPNKVFSPETNILKCRIPLLLLYHKAKEEDNLALSKHANTKNLCINISEMYECFKNDFLKDKLSFFVEELVYNTE